MFSKIIIASHNVKKTAEMATLLAPFKIDCDSLANYGVKAVEETGTSFIENALLKAKYAAKHTNLPSIADDSGLVVPTLDGEPGVYSARYAGEPTDDIKNNQKLLAELSGKTNRVAYFVSILVLVRHENDPLPIIAEGIWQGQIANQLAGTAGFGYDPLFIPNGFSQTAAELDPDIKNKHSHRALAFAKLLAKLNCISS